MSIPKINDFIIFEDDNYIVINKPPNIATLEDREQSYNILSLAVTYHPDAQVCHRLDKETSGALAIAKHPEAYKSLAVQFEKRQVKKHYHAVVEGVHDFQERVVDLNILKLSGGIVKLDREGKDAKTVFDTIQAFKGYTLINCQPITGRMHQIRIHLTNLNAPIVGDEVYGGSPFYLSKIKPKYKLKKWTEELPLIQRFALHAKQLRFENLDGTEIVADAEYPKDFRVLVKQLEKNS
ncbi:MAG: RluA family pseudouridine synthase [Bacteroidota bacterium]